MAENEPQKPSLMARTFDYILGRNTLLGLAELMLLLIAGYATWHGMRDFIVGVSASPSKPDGAGFSISNDILVIAVCVALTFLMWLALRETFGAKRSAGARMISFPLYVFLALWSIGFGYGFWWSLISGEEATRTGLAGLQEDARDAAQTVSARLDAVKGQLDSVVTWSDGQMSREETSGGSCGKESGAGRGPLYNARRSVRDQVTTLRDGMTRTWLEPVRADIELLQKAASGIGGDTVEDRQKKFEAAAASIRGRARDIASRSNEIGRSTAGEMRALAQSVSTPPGKPGFSCYDPTLAQRLTQAAEQAEQPATLKLREAVFSEGPAGVANAVKNLWKNIGTYSSSLVSYVFTGRASGRTDGGEPITGRDLIALLATIGIDLGLLAMAALNPPKEPPPVRPTGALIRHINEAIQTAVARAPGADIEWVRSHFIHHNRASYLVIPNLYSCDPGNKDESQKALAMNQLAGVLSDLDLVRWPRKGNKWLWKKSELEVLLDEEDKASHSNLTEIRQKWASDKGIKSKEADAIKEQAPMRNHGLLSKAERALQIAGWSERARADVEIFRVVDEDGLTPLLMVLSEASFAPAAATASASATASSAASAAPPAVKPAALQPIPPKA